MNTLRWSLLGLLLGSLNALSQGTVFFSTYNPSGNVNAPIFHSDGSTPLAGEGYLAQLYAGLSPDTLQPVEPATTFRTGAAAGYVQTITCTLSHVPPGAIAHLQVRAWDASGGSTFEQALLAGVPVGVSQPLTARTGNLGLPPTLPANLTGLQPFHLQSDFPAPTIVDQSDSPSILAGSSLQLFVHATGAPPLLYQWFFNGDPIPLAQSSTLEIPETTTLHTGTYTVQVSNPAGSRSSDPISVSVSPPSFPIELLATTGGHIVPDPDQPSLTQGTLLQLLAVPDPGFSFVAWSGNLSGSLNPAQLTVSGPLSIGATFAPNGGTLLLANHLPDLPLDAPLFELDATTPLAGNAYLAQLYAGTSPDTLLPILPTLPFLDGTNAGYLPPTTVVASHVPPGQPVLVQLRSWPASAGPSFESAVHALHPVGLSPVLELLTGHVGDPPSPPSPLTGLTSFSLQPSSPPTFTQQPSSLTLTVGDAWELVAAADGPPPLQYQWFKNDQPIPGATQPTFHPSAATLDDTATYTVQVSNPLGSRTSNPATVSVSLPSFPIELLATTGGHVIPNPDQPTLTQGTLLQLLAVPDPGFSFVAWSGDLSGSLNPAQLSVSGPLSIGASFSRDPVPQTLTFFLPATREFHAPPLALQATTTSGLPVSFVVVSGPATLVEGTVQFSDVGQVRIRAEQPGNEIFLAAPPVEQVIDIVPSPAALSWTDLIQVADSTPRQPRVQTDPSGLPVRITFQGRTSPPQEPGEYPVTADIDHPHYQGQITGVFVLQSPAPQFGGLIGRVFDDLDGNGSQGPSEPGIPEVAIELTHAHGSTNLLTDLHGFFHFTEVPAGSATLEALDPTGYLRTTPSLRAVSIVPGITHSLLFGKQLLQTVSGVVFHDLNGNGSQDPAEPGIPEVAIDLFLPDTQEPLHQTLTNPNGHFRFTHLAPGNYLVRQNLPDGFTVLLQGARPSLPARHQTTPPSYTTQPVLLQQNDAAGVRFANYLAGQISGSVFQDLDANAQHSPGEPGFSQHVVQLIQFETSELLATTLTDLEGSFAFTNLLHGSYHIQTAPPQNFHLPQTSVTVTVAPGGAAIASFPAQPLGRIHGLVFNDENGNGLREPQEPPMPGVSLTLSLTPSTSPPDTTPPPRTLTSASDGTFAFDQVLPGQYTLAQSVPTDFHPTTPQTRNVAVLNQTTDPIHFGNQSDHVQPPSILSPPASLEVVGTGPALFLVEADGTGPLTYQWFLNGTPIDGAQEPQLSLPTSPDLDNALVHVRVRNRVGTLSSPAATLIVSPDNPYSVWMVTHRVPNHLREPNQDPDLDHLPNLLEFLLGTHPHQSTPEPRLQAVQVLRQGQTHLGWELTRHPHARHLHLGLQATTDFTHWQPLHTSLELLESPPDADRLRILDPQPVQAEADTHQFLRLTVADRPPSQLPFRLTFQRELPLATGARILVHGSPDTTGTVEYSEDLLQWQVLQSVQIPADGLPVTVLDPDASTRPFRAYRTVTH